VNEWVELLLEPSYLLIIALFVIIVLGIAIVALWVKLNRLRKTYVKMMGSMNVTDLEQVLMDLRENMELAATRAEAQAIRLNTMESAMKTMKSRIGVKRFNAFGESGSDLSFSIALLSEQQDGVVLTGIHNRNETHMYAKPIARGKSDYRLTPEEEEAINQCAQLEPK
jgi:hypothetical protein